MSGPISGSRRNPSADLVPPPRLVRALPRTESFVVMRSDPEAATQADARNIEREIIGPRKVARGGLLASAGQVTQAIIAFARIPVDVVPLDTVVPGLLLGQWTA